ncbi:hypothetical protein A3J90_01120 [candidate division WOR-1 bacterium RIFOXYC2_FULL_37_10]|uniref:Uncharacterized protein n=1 Tax=candidate division WOR-1 bacterium RIFOXYB2_FULL_37_13 TaxID=1802579 RepID=A0A1F4STM2_UNCSA|nr:MAG: hypothetical protein A2246_04360 [candidate division WOR-1 bacterium RIFOXYA2_FULL_37_7]OGC23792.1 MAG: hypothetical protein A2310_04155 [candidate division WOR-1 bacterium RIFOXYB2_FULL_37_13]OGC33306.1 MAG: hypothetical protein A3J90_01120 [candidate division WOR-1 bacterium RIFOXYC2_FULL_37_10]
MITINEKTGTISVTKDSLGFQYLQNYELRGAILSYLFSNIARTSSFSIYSEASSSIINANINEGEPLEVVF